MNISFATKSYHILVSLSDRVKYRSMGFNVATITNDGTTLEISVGVTIIFSIDGYTPQSVVEGTKAKENEGVNEDVTTTPNKEDPTKPDVEKEDPVKPDVKKEDLVKPNVKKEAPKITVKNKDTIEQLTTIDPLYYTHTSGRSSYKDSGSYYITCPACTFIIWKSMDTSAWVLEEFVKLVESGLHAENNKVFKQPVEKKVHSDDIEVHTIDGKSSRRRTPPNVGLDVLCPMCVAYIALGKGDLNILRRGDHAHH